MAEIKINRLLNANVYSEGQSLLGKVEEVSLPAITANDTDLKVLGLMMTTKIPGGLEAMSGKMKFNAVYPEIISLFGNPFQARRIQVRGNLQTYNTDGLQSEVPAVAFMTVRFKHALPGITLKMNDNPEQESEFNCSYYRLEVDGVTMIEVDAFANIFFVSGIDVNSQYRINLGY
ncbi:phage major tail tube protein [Chitinophaga sp. CF418]|uniref:phage major tail tube protein n=1 Tax=Chitinophaga sp. CF418 TaxID=1855287 RepID=UPI000910D8A7|nr:phage major tail tube protein [Chitinophaga sp. CF418]SHN45933.1 hypothetical protein SAMN05216311_12237 [Chitinophaga sp. CF418]